MARVFLSPPDVGTRERELVNAAIDSNWVAPVGPDLTAFEHELATTLADCLLRRTMVGLNSSAGLTAVAAAGAIARKYLGWSESRVEQEVAAYGSGSAIRNPLAQ